VASVASSVLWGPPHGAQPTQEGDRSPGSFGPPRAASLPTALPRAGAPLLPGGTDHAHPGPARHGPLGLQNCMVG